MKQQNPINELTLTYPYCSRLYTVDIFNWDDCNLNNKILNLTNGYARILNQNIVAPIHNIASVPPLLIDRLASLKKLLIVDESNKIKNQHFFAQHQPNIFSQLSVLANNSAKAYNSMLVVVRNGLGNQINLQRNEMNHLNNKLLELYTNRTRLINDKIGIERRLNETQFPFGKLPLNLDQSLAAFPIALAIGFVVCVSLQRSTLHLRKEYHRWYKKKHPYPRNSNFTDQKVALVAPLWIDPISSKVNQISRFIILVTPFMIFILTIYLISDYLFLERGNQNIANYFTSDNIWIYSGLYVLSAAFFIYGCLGMIIDLRRYNI